MVSDTARITIIINAMIIPTIKPIAVSKKVLGEDFFVVTSGRSTTSTPPGFVILTISCGAIEMKDLATFHENSGSGLVTESSRS